MELDLQVSPGEIMSREVELGCESWTSFFRPLTPSVPVPSKPSRFRSVDVKQNVLVLYFKAAYDSLCAVTRERERERERESQSNILYE